MNFLDATSLTLLGYRDNSSLLMSLLSPKNEQETQKRKRVWSSVRIEIYCILVYAATLFKVYKLLQPYVYEGPIIIIT